jgi:hypothetical protein
MRKLTRIFLMVGFVAALIAAPAVAQQGRVYLPDPSIIDPSKGSLENAEFYFQGPMQIYVTGIEYEGQVYHAILEYDGAGRFNLWIPAEGDGPMGKPQGLDLSDIELIYDPNTFTLTIREIGVDGMAVFSGQIQTGMNQLSPVSATVVPGSISYYPSSDTMGAQEEAALRSQISRLNGTITDLRADVADLQAQVRAKDAEIAELASAEAEPVDDGAMAAPGADASADQLRATISTLQAAIRDREMLIAQQQDTITSGEQTIASQQETIASQQETIASGEATIERLIDEGVALINDARALIASGEQVIVQGTAVIASQQETIASGEQTIASGEQTIASQQQTIASGEETIASGEDTITQLVDEGVQLLDEARALIISGEKVIVSQQETIEALSKGEMLVDEDQAERIAMLEAQIRALEAQLMVPDADDYEDPIFQVQRGFAGQMAQRGVWNITAERAAQTDANERFGKVVYAVEQDAEEMMFTFTGRARDEGWTGMGLHFLASDVSTVDGYGFGNSYLVWLTKDPSRQTDRTFVQLYRSYDDVRMIELASSAIREDVGDLNEVSVFVDTEAMVLTVAVNGDSIFNFHDNDMITEGTGLAIRALGEAEFIDFAASAK